MTSTTASAVISPCGRYRYVLHRELPQPLRWVKPALFIMLNPSTADATQDDPTIRRCIGFAKYWGCTSLTVVNLFALRSTDPSGLAIDHDPVGPDNDTHIAEQIRLHSLGVIVGAWGAHPFARKRAEEVMQKHGPFSCLGTTKAGAPRHPLYVKADVRPINMELCE
jgi:hypothetical protein